MKKALLALAFTSLMLIACQNESKEPSKSLVVASDSTNVNYECPMKCQSDTSYTTAGNCPICEMELVEL